MVIEQAMRWGMSPFAVAQCTSSIGGKLMYEGKLVAAAIESIGAIEGHLEYKFSGEGEDLAVTVSGLRAGEEKPQSLTIKLKDVRTTNEQWKKQPEQQLSYSGARNWARRFTPAALLGVYAPEEGRSPLARGNQGSRPYHVHGVGTIPARAGEPARWSSPR